MSRELDYCVAVGCRVSLSQQTTAWRATTFTPRKGWSVHFDGVYEGIDEIQGLYRACDAALADLDGGCNVTIYTDSQGLFDALVEYVDLPGRLKQHFMDHRIQPVLVGPENTGLRSIYEVLDSE